MTQNLRIDLHSHSIFSDGELIPAELFRRAETYGYNCLAITDHADASNVEFVVTNLIKFVEAAKAYSVKFLPGVEITHVRPEQIAGVAKKAKELGAKIICVHGETIVEPVYPGTNRAAAEAKGLVDFIAHPGLIAEEEVKLAAHNGVYLEITTRSGHNYGNGHVAKLARKHGAKLILNTDTHSPGNLVNFEMAQRIALGAGLDEPEVRKALVDNPLEIIKSKGVTL